MSQDKRSNHAKAPIAARNVEALRAAFGDVRVLYVHEGDFMIGERGEEVAASCFFYGTGQRIQELQG